MIFSNNKVFDDNKLCLTHKFKIEYTEECTSTMDLAMAEAEANKIYVTDYQTKGQARFANRSWQSPKGKNLLMTLTLKQVETFYLSPLKVATAISNMLRTEFLLESNVKWPNDIMVEDKKLAGILCKTDGKMLYIGIGLNVNQQEFSDDINATSMANSLFNEQDRDLVFERLVSYLDFFLCNKRWSDEAWLKEINKVLYNKNQIMSYMVADKEITGKLLQVRNDGALLIETKAGQIEAIFAGEASRKKN